MKSVLSVVLSATAPWSVTSHTAPVIAGDKPVWYGAEWHPATNAATRKGARHTGWRWRWRWACKCCIVQNFLVIKVINKNETSTTTAAHQHQFKLSFFFLGEVSKEERYSRMLVFAAVVVRVLALASKGTCPSTNPGVCYPHSMPIIKTLHDVDPADCCTACKL